MDPPPSRRPCFVEEDDGLASLAEMEAGKNTQRHHAFISRSLCLSSSVARRASFRSLSGCSSRSFKSFDSRFEGHRPHFLDSCSLCNKRLGRNIDIFMYRGNTPFCSEECRQEQIEIDEATENQLSLSSMKAMREKDRRKSFSSSSPSKSSAQGYSFMNRTVAAA